MRALGFTALLLLAAAPAAAQQSISGGRYGSPSPCDHYVPTGEALPREDTVVAKRLLSGEPGRGRRAGSTVAGDKVTVLQECGAWARIRTSDGQEGWAPIRILPHELALQQAAERRPAATPQDCELRFSMPSMVHGCEQGIVQRQAREDELAHSITLTGAELNAAASGKTFEVVRRNLMTGERANDAPPLLVFFDPGGESFSMVQGHDETRLRGRWYIEDGKLCVPTTGGTAIGALRRTAAGAVVWVMSSSVEYLTTPRDGDPVELAKRVKAVFPYPAPPPVPPVLAGVAHPVMGW